ncbi:FadR family transcriptional regulator [Saccharopolyspora rhizosphaerae]|uniref:FadR family transcriptional regulator n=1 Tax=Saccharopolyspora rhizosphaerae TaxID=2492662 RepID=A0A426K3G7_9PSEU|nr:FadR/GntR family transcriptional regulator [Saccharopolyspora rhizosphaerae]RRO19919.1 FadR family transcriptional regulator [Saccharopolyspora rhizosphaerae]
MSLPDELAEQLLGSIIDGTYSPGGALPSEAELAELFSMSRLTVREAIKALRVQDVVRIERGRGTYVNPPTRWTSLHALVRAATSPGAVPEVVTALHEARRVLESGAAELAALQRTDADLTLLRQHLREMAEAADAEARCAAHLAFHRAIAHATGNPLVPLLFEPFTRAAPAASDTARHEALLAAIEAHDPAGARRSVDAHLHVRGTRT